MKEHKVTPIDNSLDNFMIWVGTQIFFGKTALEHLPEGVNRFGKRILMVYGGGSIKRNGVYDQVTSILKENGNFVVELGGVQPNPRVSLIRKGIEVARENKVDMVLAVGGGSVIDSAKGIACGYYYDGDVWELAGKTVSTDKVLPVLTVLTIPATSSEMATGSTWLNDTIVPHKKAGAHGPYMRPRVSYLNPEFTYTLPAKQTAAGVSDIMSHIIESYFSNEKRAYLQARTAEGMLKTLIKYTPIALAEPDNYEARANIMYCGSWGNNGYIVKGNYVSWSVHGLENSINEACDNTHGEGLAVLTPHWMRWAMRDENLYRYVDFAVNVFGVDPTLPEREIAERGIQELEAFYEKIGMPKKLSELGAKYEDIEKYAERFNLPGTMAYQDGAFIPIRFQDAVEIYKAAF